MKDKSKKIAIAVVIIIITMVAIVSAVTLINIGKFNYNITVSDLPVTIDSISIPTIINEDVDFEVWGTKEITKEICNNGDTACCVVSFTYQSNSTDLTIEVLPEMMVLEAGECKMVTFAFTAESAGTYAVNISADATKCEEITSNFLVSSYDTEVMVNPPVSGRELSVTFNMRALSVGPGCHDVFYFELPGDVTYGDEPILSDYNWTYGSSMGDAYVTHSDNGHVSMLMQNEGYCTFHFTLSPEFATVFDTTGESCAIPVKFHNRDGSWSKIMAIGLTYY